MSCQQTTPLTERSDDVLAESGPSASRERSVCEQMQEAVYTCNVALGRGSARCGGAPSTADGHFIAFGCTEEDLRKKVFRLEQIGSPSTAPGSAFDRTNGTGYVAACDGD